MDMGSELNLDGAGDRTHCYVKRKLANGLPVPVFIGPQKTDQNYDDKDGICESQTAGNKCDRDNKTAINAIDVLNKFLDCAICRNTCIETTTTNCGHKFCRQCIDEWRKQKEVCPTCGTLVTSQHRLYSDDLFVESQLPYLHPEIKRRFETAQKKRLQMIIDDQKSRNVIKSVRKRLENSLTFLKCKNSRLKSKIHSTSRMFINKLTEWSGKSYLNIFLAVVIGILFLFSLKYLANNTQFLHYMWLAIKNYNGEIPVNWIHTGNVTEESVPPATENKTLFESLVESLQIFPWA